MIENIMAGGYGIVPKNLFKDSEISRSSVLIYSYLLTYTGAGNDTCWPSIETICQDCGIGKTTAIKCLKELEDYKYLQKEKLNSNPFNRGNKYKILIFSTIESSNSEPSESSNSELSHINTNYKYNNTGISTEVKTIISYLNEKADKNYRYTTSKTKTLISARIKEGFTVDDFKKVIDVKVIDWKEDQKMCDYLRPETLFGTKFESYLNQKLPKQKEKQLGLLNSTDKVCPVCGFELRVGECDMCGFTEGEYPGGETYHEYLDRLHERALKNYRGMKDEYKRKPSARTI